jgi:hypothetical protein
MDDERPASSSSSGDGPSAWKRVLFASSTKKGRDDDGPAQMAAAIPTRAGKMIRKMMRSSCTTLPRPSSHKASTVPNIWKRRELSPTSRQ